MGSRGGRRRENGGWCVQPLSPLMEGPDLDMQYELSNNETTMIPRTRRRRRRTNTNTNTNTSSSSSSSSNYSSSWEVLREWFRVHMKNNIPGPNGNRFSMSNSPSTLYGDRIRHVSAKRQDLRLLLGVLACPLAPIPLSIIDDFRILHPPPQINIKDIPIETSMAHYIIQQYLAATGCIKQQQGSSSSGSMMVRKNMYTAGALKLICCETEISSSTSSGYSSGKTGGGGGGGGVRSIGRRRGESGCFVLWQMNPGMWSLELVVGDISSGGGGGGQDDKVIAGSDGKIVWRHTPWLGTHVAKGPHRPLRRIIQGLDPKSTAKLFGEAQCLGEKRIGEEDCFVLRAAADRAAVMERNEGPAEVIRHVLYGYFSQRSGLLIYLEDSHLTRVQQPPPPPRPPKAKAEAEATTRTVYWETTIGSSIGDYREVDGVLIAHGGRTIATVFRFGEQQHSSSASASTEHYYYSRTRMEEIWRIDDVVFNVPGLSLDSFIPPADI